MENYLLTYFKLIASLACDKAKEHAEKRKSSEIASQLQASLVQFAQCEKNYYSLVFLEQKWFGRRDPLKNTYSALEGDLRSFAKQQAKLGEIAGGKATWNGTVLVSEQLANFCVCRMDCIEVYENCVRMIPLRDVEKMILDLALKHEGKFSHPVLEPVTSSFDSEFETFKRLVSASILIGDRNFFSSLMELHKIHQTLIAWQPLLNKEQHHTYSFRTGLFGFGEKHATSSVSAVYEWMAKYYQSLVSKFSFYFYEKLSSQGKPDEVKMLLTKTSHDYVAKAQSFCKKMVSAHVLLVCETEEPWFNSSEMPASFRSCLEIPSPCPEYLLPDLDTFLKSKAEEINAEKIVFHYSREFDFSYYAAQTDPGLTLVVTIEGRKSEKDSYILNFINEVAGHARPKRIFTMLRPGSK